MPQGQNKCFFSRFYRNYKIRIASPCNFNCVLILGNCTYLLIAHSATYYFVRPAVAVEMLACNFDSRQQQPIFSKRGNHTGKDMINFRLDATDIYSQELILCPRFFELSLLIPRRLKVYFLRNYSTARL